MENFGTVRRAATELRVRIDPELTEVPASQLVERALEDLGLELERLEPDDPGLASALGVLNRQFATVLVRRDLDPETAAEVIAHEIGHFVVHQAPEAAVRDGYAQPGPGDPVQRVEAYGVKERREAQANVFARELVLPRALARRMFGEGLRAHAIASRLGLRLETVFQQLSDAMLLPEPVPPAPEARSPARPPDRFQEAAADHRGEAFLLEAGPGTGKTRTLVERIVRLIQRGEADPEHILALTFSNKAAGELADRVEAAAGTAAANIWTGTFHAFGLELLRKHHEIFGKGQDPRLIDGSEAIHLLEDTLPTLPIVHLQNLFEPALALKEMLRAISRAKDELVGPARYAELAREMERAAGSEEEAVAAAKAGEVALVYDHYQRALEERGAVDYGDLVMLPAVRLRENPEFRAALSDRFRWVHVDEYQDINRASAVLVKGIVGDGRNLWVVGDARQSIYRFRGASTLNMARFAEDYPVSRRAQLGINYRSTEPIVRAFCAFGGSMRVSEYALPIDLETERQDVGTSPSCLVAPDPDAEMDHLAGSIRELERNGVLLRDQAVLARSNGTLARIGEELEARGVPVLYLGPLFDRPEVRDLLSLLSLVVNSGSTLLRVGGFAEYGVSVPDTVRLLDEAKDKETRAIDLLRRIEDVEVLSEAGRRGLSLLAEHIQGLGPGNTPWLVLMEYLFERSDYARTLLTGQAPADDMRRVAVRQLIEAIRSMPLRGGRSPIARGLDRVRHMVLLADDRELRRLPDELSHLDGVHLLTVHASKGLEFGAVHLPGLRAGAVPASNRPERCPPPAGLILNPAEEDAHEAEEECLFFVALSRAKTHLRLSRPSTSGGKKSNPSRFLAHPCMNLPPPAASVPMPRSRPRAAHVPILEPAPPASLTSRDFDSYGSCARRFFYDRVAGLRGEAPESAYFAAHRCLLAVLDAARAASEPLDEEAIRAAFEQAWAESGLPGHVFEGPYRDLVEGMLAGLGPKLRDGMNRNGLSVDLGGTTVAVKPDQVTGAVGARVLRTIRSGRPSSSEADRLSNALLLEAARQHHEGLARVETFHIATGETTDISQTEAKRRNRLTSCTDIAAAIGRGEYPPEPSDWACPRCRHFFLCPAPVTPPGD